MVEPVRDLLKEEFEKINEKYGPARSFTPGENPPNDAKEIYRTTEEMWGKKCTIIYYIDKDHNLYYENMAISEFDREMRERDRIRRIRKRMGS